MVRDDSYLEMMKESYTLIKPQEIVSLNMKVSVNEGGYISPFTGHLIRGFLLKMISDIDPDLSAKLHSKNVRKSFSIAPLRNIKRRKYIEKNLWRLDRGEVLDISLRFFDQQLSSLIPEILYYISKYGISLGSINFSILEHTVKSTSFKNLLALGGNIDTSKPYRFVLTFHSPTRFEIKSTTFPMLMPIPHFVFKSLGDLWNSYAPDDLRIDVDLMLDELKNHIFVSNYRLSNEKHRLRGDLYVAGFTGFAEYRSVGQVNESSLRLIPILCKFGEYASVGAKRSYGYGHMSFREIH